MGLWANLFGPTREPFQISAGSFAALATSLQLLPPRGIGWITFADAAGLYSVFHQPNVDLGGLEDFAAEHRCKMTVEQSEQRIYFRKGG